MLRNALPFILCLTALAVRPGAATRSEVFGLGSAPVEFTLVKGDTREGSRITMRIDGDSLFYTRTTYVLSGRTTRFEESGVAGSHRLRTLKRVMDDLPQYKRFGTCFGKGMQFFRMEAGEERFYRSLPERGAHCYADEPGIWNLFDDLEDLLAPPRPSERNGLS